MGGGLWTPMALARSFFPEPFPTLRMILVPGTMGPPDFIKVALDNETPLRLMHRQTRVTLPEM